MPGPLFKPGNPGSTGRPRGSRNRLARRFVDDLAADWEANGAAAIRIMRHEDPTAYVKVVAAILPREFEFTNTVIHELDDDALTKYLEDARERFAALEQQPMMIEHAACGGAAKVPSND